MLRRGARRRPLVPCAAVRAALDIGGTKLLAAATVDGGALGPARRRPTPANEPLRAVREMLDEVSGGAALEGIALSVPGPFLRHEGRLLDPPNMPPAWHGLDLAAPLRQAYGCPVLLENDANCAGLAEALQGAGAGLPTVVYLTVSTGIGSGVVHQGRLHLGRHDTEGGHMVLWPQHLGGIACHCGGHGCLEALASGGAVRRRFGVAPEQLEDQAAWDDVGRWLGLGIVNAVTLHDPDAVVLGGGLCAAWDRFWPSLTATIDAALHIRPRPPVLRATLGEERNLLGALALLSG